MKDQLKQALAAVKNGEEVRARAIVAGLLKEQPENVAGWVLLSKLAENEVQKAAFLHKVIALDPDNEYAAVELSLLEGEEEAVERTEPVVAEAEAEDGEPVAAPARGPEETTQAAAEAEVTAPAEEAPVAVPATKLPMRELDAEEDAEEAEELKTPPTPPVSEEPFAYDAQAEGETLPPWLADEEAVLASTAATEPAPEETAPPADLPEWLQEQPEEQWPGEVEGEVSAGISDMDTEPMEQRAEATAAKKPATRLETKSEESMSWVAIGLGILLILIFLAFVYSLLTLL